MDRHLREKLFGMAIVGTPVTIVIGLLLLAHALGKIG